MPSILYLVCILLAVPNPRWKVKGTIDVIYRLGGIYDDGGDGGDSDSDSVGGGNDDDDHDQL